MSKKSIQLEFEKKAEEYESNRISSWYKAHSDLVLESMADTLPCRILDVGSATGYFLRSALQLFPRATAVANDLAPRMNEVALSRLDPEIQPRVRFIAGDFESLDFGEFANSRFDLITCLNTFHYFDDPKSALKKMHRLLLDEGRLVILDRDLGGGILTRLWDFAHRTVIKDNARFYSAEAIAEYMRKSGFSNINIRIRINRYFWKGKLSTNIAILNADNRSVEGSR